MKNEIKYIFGKEWLLLLSSLSRALHRSLQQKDKNLCTNGLLDTVEPRSACKMKYSSTSLDVPSRIR